MSTRFRGTLFLYTIKRLDKEKIIYTSHTNEINTLFYAHININPHTEQIHSICLCLCLLSERRSTVTVLYDKLYISQYTTSHYTTLHYTTLHHTTHHTLVNTMDCFNILNKTVTLVAKRCSRSRYLYACPILRFWNYLYYISILTIGAECDIRAGKKKVPVPATAGCTFPSFRLEFPNLVRSKFFPPDFISVILRTDF